MSAWLTTQVAGPEARVGLQVIAVDGKTARGARRGDGRAVHLFAALSQDTSVVLGQCALDAKINEINTFGPLLDRLNITGAIINADALHTQRPTSPTCPSKARTPSSSPRTTSPGCTVNWPPCPGNRSHPLTPRPERATVGLRPGR